MWRSAGARRSDRLLLLGYHNIESTWRWPARPGVGRRRFAGHVRALSRFANVLPLDSAVADLQAGRALPERAVAITFDDGYRDNLDVAVPILAAAGAPATVFLVPGFLSGTVVPWWEYLAHAVHTTRRPVLPFRGRELSLDGARARAGALAVVEEAVKELDDRTRQDEVRSVVERLEPPEEFDHRALFLDWDGAAGLVDAGIGIGSHTTSHSILSREHPAEQASDLLHSRFELMNVLGTTVDGLAYPNGTRADYDRHSIDGARSAGHRYAVTTTPGPSDGTTPRFELRRRLVLSTQPVERFVARLARDLMQDIAEADRRVRA
ncbi:polysaccharide deacetylase family protein [Pseudonocardia alni]|uniref:polysaccharide deacetylase family protein n=1 Tax=Pseudonocardia alni TaxID=33907 RepID=UPI0027A29B40|nr:polysaccharide deacetylase family protein [Pseudonocardia alni]